MDMREVFTIDGRRFSNMAGFYDVWSRCSSVAWIGRSVGT